MKLDFLKDGLINTANFIPAYAVGEINTNPVVLTVNVIGRILALYLCFQYNADLEPKSLVIALLFPTLYIIYIIAVKGIDSVLEKFDLETTDFTEMFDSDEGKCVERKGPDGDMKSVPKDKKRCENIEGNLYNSKILCESITDSEDTNAARAEKRNEAGVCKYISKSSDVRRCRDFEYLENCTGSGFGCEWNDYSNYSAPQKSQICSQHLDSKLNECPEICPYYQEGNVSFNVLKGDGGMFSISLSKGFLPEVGAPEASIDSEHAVEPLNGINEDPALVTTSVSTPNVSNQRLWKFTTNSNSGLNGRAAFFNPGTVEATVDKLGPEEVYDDANVFEPLLSPRTITTLYSDTVNDTKLINGFPVKKPITNRKFDNEFIAVAFDTAQTGNTFAPLMSTDYRGKNVQIRVTANDNDNSIKVISGKVRLVMKETDFTSLEYVTNYDIIANAQEDPNNSKNNIYGSAQVIGGSQRKSGKYVVIIQPVMSSLMNFYNDIDLVQSTTKDTLEKKLIFAKNIQVVISNSSSSCGKLYLNTDLKTDPFDDNLEPNILVSSSLPVGVDINTVYTETIGDLAWSGQKGGMCINPE